ncbi:MAG: FHA domain-containing protein [Anaerolineae bacterium]
MDPEPTNLYLQSDWSENQRILRYTIYSVNQDMMPTWSDDVLNAIRYWDINSQPRILFDLSHPNASMSYFVLSQRDIFNIGITAEGKAYFLKFLESNPQIHVKLAVVLSNTMLGGLGKYIPPRYSNSNFTAKLFFERDPAEYWLTVEPDEGTFDTSSITSEMLLRVIHELEGHEEDVYGDRDYLRVLVNDSLETVPIEQGRPIIVGRNSRADLDLSAFGRLSRSVSRRHAQIALSNGRLSIIDLESRNGTYVSGRKIEPGKAVFIRRNDVIRVGNIEFSVLF